MTRRDCLNKLERLEKFYQRQIKGLILIMQQNNGTLFVSRKYVVEKLDMILNGGLSVSDLIEEKLDE